MLIGYARVSTADQNTQQQIDALRELGVPEDAIHVDHGYTGTNTNRPALDAALNALKAGDTLIVKRLDRLGRSMPDLIAIAAQIEAKGATLQIDRTPHDPSDPMGKMFFTVLGAMAQLERDLISLRTIEGVARAKVAGKFKGSAPKLDDDVCIDVLDRIENRGRTVAETARQFDVSRPTIYRMMERARRLQSTT